MLHKPFSPGNPWWPAMPRPGVVNPRSAASRAAAPIFSWSGLGSAIPTLGNPQMLMRAKEARLTGSRVTHTTRLYTVTLTAVELSLLGTRATYSFNWHLQSLTVVRCAHALTLPNILVILAGLLCWAVARSVGCRPLPARSRRSSPSHC